MVNALPSNCTVRVYPQLAKHLDKLLWNAADCRQFIAIFCSRVTIGSTTVGFTLIEAFLPCNQEND